MVELQPIKVYGLVVDAHTRCQHYQTDLDIIAIKFACCSLYFPCYQCHQESSNHEIKRWNQNQLISENIVLCGECWNEMTFKEYKANKCLYCDAKFNPKCKLHYDIYFDINGEDSLS